MKRCRETRRSLEEGNGKHTKAKEEILKTCVGLIDQNVASLIESGNSFLARLYLV